MTLSLRSKPVMLRTAACYQSRHVKAPRTFAATIAAVSEGICPNCQIPMRQRIGQEVCTCCGYMFQVVST